MSTLGWLLGTGRSSSIAFGRGQGSMCFCLAVGFLLGGDTEDAAVCVAVGFMMYAASGVQEWVEKR